MSNKIEAFKEPIGDGLVRILFRISSVKCEVENDAPDFVDPREDQPAIKIIPEADITNPSKVFEQNYELVLNPRKTEGEIITWDLKNEGIWFDIPMDDVKYIWLSEFNFYVESAKPRYLTYYIQDVEHRIEWLQVDESGAIISLSEFKKKFTPPPVSERETFTGSEIMKCGDMIGRAAKKIDIRTGKAMIKLNTEKGRLEPLLISLAKKLGYLIEPLDKETVYKQSETGNSVSHIISLK